MQSLPVSMKRIRSRTGEKKWQHHFSQFMYLVILQKLKGSSLCSKWSNLAIFQTPLRSFACHYNYKKYWLKNSRKNVVTSFFKCSRVADSVVYDRIWPNFALIKTLMYFNLPASKKKIRSKTTEKSGNTVFPIISLLDFYTKGELTPQSVVGIGQISNSFKILCMSLLLASMKKIGGKTTKKKVVTPFSPL